ncbi:cellulose synthase [Curtobacterium sp. MCJR17_055]|uniref:glycosyltransferase n=1 Tax=unclassified Curtobacterium TaxID=257496 RepID=UPI000D8A46C1|nr:MULTISPECIES: glycosyltransferase [unclassified Curtobacterium]PYY36846.1 cellulose synthase [Curtobacterium sp. MCBD17_029]PYY37545.1 cellulose synthase [Curtobacterium sp. MCPF17_046]PYY58043.1 cellulose synthase [Curtobacterium sp. MCPF17_015]PYY58493.1 cellulose synthase [Curtobacterium sp. MCJR17_055]PZE95265.1 cellulose synthase [Curtobacterium sp. MCBD17_008]
MTAVEVGRQDRRRLEVGTPRRRLLAVRTVAVLAAVSGINYIAWRWVASVNWHSWWIAVPLILAETYSVIDSVLFAFGAWKLRERGEPPTPPSDPVTVDVFITTYNEPIDLVMRTARAAKAIRHPHETWILDDGNRPEMRAAAEAEGLGVITRGKDWVDRPRHAKAGNLNNALLATQGEFLLILDADQVPDPAILDRTLGYFKDERMALVQTPQWFENVPDSDPLGSQAPLFYGPIQQSKDGWNAAFFCGSNAILRREALMQLGITRYVREVETSVQRTVKTAKKLLARARENETDPRVLAALDDAEVVVEQARADIATGEPLGDVTYRFQRGIDAIAFRFAAADLEAVRAELQELAAMSTDANTFAGLDDAALDVLGQRDASPVAAIEAIAVLTRALDVNRDDEAQPIMPLATISVTEDMATAMRLHGLGWKSAYHDEILAKGLAPEDLQTMLVQRLRWAQGTMQVFFRENPLVQKGLSFGQRLMYFSTMWSYLSGFAAVVYIAAPVLCLSFGVVPVQAYSVDFFVRLIPFLVLNQLLFWVVAAGRPTWRGQQYSLALFPVWIESVTSAFENVFRGKPLGFRVTPKVRDESEARPRWDLVRPQLIAMGALVAALVMIAIRYLAGQAEGIAPLVNTAWVVFDLFIFSIVIRAVRYRGPEAEMPLAHESTTVGGPL